MFEYLTHRELVSYSIQAVIMRGAGAPTNSKRFAPSCSVGISLKTNNGILLSLTNFENLFNNSVERLSLTSKSGHLSICELGADSTNQSGLDSERLPLDESAV